LEFDSRHHADAKSPLSAAIHPGDRTKDSYSIASAHVQLHRWKMECRSSALGSLSFNESALKESLLGFARRITVYQTTYQLKKLEAIGWIPHKELACAMSRLLKGHFEKH
jgi:hypothetical protein